MKIKLQIFDSTEEPFKEEYTGNYAVETMLRKVVEKYFGPKIADAVENLLRTRINAEDV